MNPILALSIVKALFLPLLIILLTVLIALLVPEKKKVSLEKGSSDKDEEDQWENLRDLNRHLEQICSVCSIPGECYEFPQLKLYVSVDTYCYDTPKKYIIIGESRGAVMNAISRGTNGSATYRPLDLLYLIFNPNNKYADVELADDHIHYNGELSRTINLLENDGVPKRAEILKRLATG